MSYSVTENPQYIAIL